MILYRLKGVSSTVKMIGQAPTDGPQPQGLGLPGDPLRGVLYWLLTPLLGIVKRTGASLPIAVVDQPVNNAHPYPLSRLSSTPVAGQVE